MKYEDVLSGKTPKKEKKTKTPSNYPISVGRTIAEPDTGLTFTVVDEDVVGSVVADKESCAAAKALCKLPDIEHAWVFRSRTLVRRSSGAIERYQNPRNLQKAVEGYDNSAGLFPAGEYELRPLIPSNRKESKKFWNEAHPERSGGKRPYEYVATSPKPLRKK